MIPAIISIYYTAIEKLLRENGVNEQNAHEYELLSQLDIESPVILRRKGSRETIATLNLKLKGDARTSLV